MRQAIYPGAIILACMSVACNTSSFGGSSGQDQGASATKPGAITSPSSYPGFAPTPPPGGPAQPSPAPFVSASSPPVITPPVNSTGNGPNPLSGILSSLLQTVNEPVAVQTNANTVVYGGSKVFHLGDGQDGGSSCRVGIALYGVAGQHYYFQFQVTQPGTNVTINVAYVCGVDYPDTNFASIVSEANNQTLQQVPIPTDATSLQIAAQGLAPGWYHLYVESRTGTQSGGETTDADDYLIGNIQVQGSAPISPGQVGAN